MIPFIEWRIIALGPVQLQVWGLFAAIGVILGTGFAMRMGRRRGMDPGRIETLAFWTVLAAFVGARLFHVVFYEPGYYWVHPLDALAVWKGGLSSFGGFFGAAIAFTWQARKQGFSFRKIADVTVPATVLGLGCGRIGCFLIHDHPGTMAYGLGRLIAVKYPDGPRYDLGLLLGLLDFLLFALFLILLRKRRKPGSLLVFFLLIYGPSRFLLDFLRVDDARLFGLTPGQYGSAILFVIGVVMARRLRYPEEDIRPLP